ncbi:hypothetical protein QUF49_02365 [Fictibacillus sp. b24]|uniref:hypothetical protein n=1 Tax=Fictibacillus sp. b24 TaxID=3055863 RepID=UPI0025A1B3E7|nr:hypothetical protein [Fictibacillus sp. b24]MDM5314818.1 hypothetical protein [Fictibacillus sp. b24]
MIGVKGARLLRDKRSGETPKGAKRQGAHRSPRGKRVPVTEINLFQEQQSLRKELILLERML